MQPSPRTQVAGPGYTPSGMASMQPEPSPRTRRGPSSSTRPSPPPMQTGLDLNDVAQSGSLPAPRVQHKSKNPFIVFLEGERKWNEWNRTLGATSHSECVEDEREPDEERQDCKRSPCPCCGCPGGSQCARGTHHTLGGNISPVQPPPIQSRMPSIRGSSEPPVRSYTPPSVYAPHPTTIQDFSKPPVRAYTPPSVYAPHPITIQDFSKPPVRSYTPPAHAPPISAPPPTSRTPHDTLHHDMVPIVRPFTPPVDRHTLRKMLRHPRANRASSTPHQQLEVWFDTLHNLSTPPPRTSSSYHPPSRRPTREYSNCYLGSPRPT